MNGYHAVLLGFSQIIRLWLASSDRPVALPHHPPLTPTNRARGRSLKDVVYLRQEGIEVVEIPGSEDEGKNRVAPGGAGTTSPPTMRSGCT